MPSKPKKLTNKEVTRALIKKRRDIMANAGYSSPKYLDFCEAMLDIGYRVTLYEARETVSKYVTVYGAGDTEFKVRFSNHLPNRTREIRGDCDFFVGQTHQGKWQSTSQAIAATVEYFNAL